MDADARRRAEYGCHYCGKTVSQLVADAIAQAVREREAAITEGQRLSDVATFQLARAEKQAEEITQLRAALVKHACPIMVGQGSVYCAEHKVYHRPDIDEALRAGGEGAK